MIDYAAIADRVSPAPAGIGPERVPLITGPVGFPRARGDRPLSEYDVTLALAFPPRPRG